MTFTEEQRAVLVAHRDALLARVAELEAALADVRGMYISVQQRRTGKGYVATEAELDAELHRRQQARAAQRAGGEDAG